MNIGNISLEKGSIIKTKYDCVTKVIDFKREAISGIPIIIVDKECKGQYDEKHGYDKTYGENYWIYPGEVVEVLEEEKEK